MPNASEGDLTCEPIRETFASGDIEGQRAWLRRDVEAPFHVPRKLPFVKAVKVREVGAPVQRSLFELCGDPGLIQPGLVGHAEPETVEDQPAPDRKRRAPSPSALLTALIDDAGVGRRRPREVAIVEAAIAASIPADVPANAPSFVAEILSVRPCDEGLIARVRLFDGGIGTLTASGGSEPAVVDWTAEGDLRDFGHLDGVWVRIDEPVVAPIEEPAIQETAAAELSAMDRLVASGIANEYIAGLGALLDPDNRAPYSPRSIGFPVTLHRVGGPFQPPTAPRIWELHLSTPACGGLPFVRKVEEVTGLLAKWDPNSPWGSLGQWHHAVDLANDSDWERLASSMEHTTPMAVSRAVGLHILSGSLSVAHACRLLPDVGIEEPEERAFPNLRPNQDGSLMTGFEGWEAVYAVEDDLIVPGNPKRGTFARVTDAGWRSVGKEPPAPAPKKSKAKTGPPAD